MKKLELGQLYNRQDVHKIFGGDSNYTKGAGVWGLQGMIEIPDDKYSWVFFVTLGHKEAHHEFEEGITEEGVLIWQSQPNLALQSPKVQKLINFDSDKHNIYLFFRTEKIDSKSKLAKDYVYLGKLDYLAHDINSSKPVFFNWQLLDWEEVKGAVESLITYTSLKLIHQNPTGKNVSESKQNYEIRALVKSEKPTRKAKETNFTRKFSGSLNLKPERAKAIGNLAEKLVLEFEKSKLIESGRKDLADKVIHSAVDEGDGLGYDIKTYTLDGKEKYIEVKATTQSEIAKFYISLNELEFAKHAIKNNSNYVIYRVYNLNEKLENGQFFEINATELLNEDNFRLEATQFSVKPIWED